MDSLRIPSEMYFSNVHRSQSLFILFEWYLINIHVFNLVSWFRNDTLQFSVSTETFQTTRLIPSCPLPVAGWREWKA